MLSADFTLCLSDTQPLPWVALMSGKHTLLDSVVTLRNLAEWTWYVMVRHESRRDIPGRKWTQDLGTSRGDREVRSKVCR